MTCSRVTPQGLLSVTDDPAAARRYPSIGAPRERASRRPACARGSSICESTPRRQPASHRNRDGSKLYRNVAGCIMFQVETGA
jgi:hypothetical protein